MRTALIVAPSPAERVAAGGALAALGFVVHASDEATSALRRCRWRLPDLVLVDLEAGERSGLDLMGAIRALPGGLGTVVVFTATAPSQDTVHEVIGAGADRVIGKPLTRNSLLREIASLPFAYQEYAA